MTASGLVVLGDAGFAPDAEGFTLLGRRAPPPARSRPPDATELIAGSAG